MCMKSLERRVVCYSFVRKFQSYYQCNLLHQHRNECEQTYLHHKKPYMAQNSTTQLVSLPVARNRIPVHTSHSHPNKNLHHKHSRQRCSSQVHRLFLGGNQYMSVYPCNRRTGQSSCWLDRSAPNQSYKRRSLIGILAEHKHTGQSSAVCQQGF